MGTSIRCWMVHCLVVLAIIRSGSSSLESDWKFLMFEEPETTPGPPSITATGTKVSSFSSISINSTTTSINSSDPVPPPTVFPPTNKSENKNTRNSNSNNRNSTNSSNGPLEELLPNSVAVLDESPMEGQAPSSCILQSHKEDIVILANIIIDLIDEFKEDYIDRNFRTSWEVIDKKYSRRHDRDSLEVCDVDQVCSQVLPTLPEEDTQLNLTWQEKLVLAAKYADLYLIALEQLFLDQSLSEDVFMEEMDKVYRELSMFSTKLLQRVMGSHLIPDTSALKDLVPKMYTKTRNWIMQKRGFMTPRQVRLGMQHIVDLVSE